MFIFDLLTALVSELSFENASQRIFTTAMICKKNWSPISITAMICKNDWSPIFTEMRGNKYQNKKMCVK